MSTFTSSSLREAFATTQKLMGGPLVSKGLKSLLFLLPLTTFVACAAPQDQTYYGPTSAAENPMVRAPQKIGAEITYYNPAGKSAFVAAIDVGSNKPMPVSGVVQRAETKQGPAYQIRFKHGQPLANLLSDPRTQEARALHRMLDTAFLNAERSAQINSSIEYQDEIEDRAARTPPGFPDDVSISPVDYYGNDSTITVRANLKGENLPPNGHKLNARFHPWENDSRHLTASIFADMILNNNKHDFSDASPGATIIEKGTFLKFAALYEAARVAYFRNPNEPILCNPSGAPRDAYIQTEAANGTPGKILWLDLLDKEALENVLSKTMPGTNMFSAEANIAIMHALHNDMDNAAKPLWGNNLSLKQHYNAAPQGKYNNTPATPPSNAVPLPQKSKAPPSVKPGSTKPASNYQAPASFDPYAAIPGQPTGKFSLGKGPTLTS